MYIRLILPFLSTRITCFVDRSIILNVLVHQKSPLGGQETVGIPGQAVDDYARPTAPNVATLMRTSGGNTALRAI